LLEKIWNSWKSGLKKVGQWCKEHWVEILIGFACIVVGALLTFFTAGAAAFLPALLAGLKAAAIAGLISGGISTVLSIGASLITGEDFTTLLGKALNAFGDGLASGFKFGGIFAGVSQSVSAIFKLSAKIGATGTSLGNLKFWSPNSLTNPNSGGTLFKIGKTFRIDFEAGKQLFHIHITSKLFNSFPQAIQSMWWLFDPGRQDAHVRLTGLLGGIWGAVQRQK